VNNDGLADVCGRGSDGIWCGVSTGSFFSTVTQWTAKFNDSDGWKSDPSYWNTIQFRDLNHDGLADVCGRGSDGIWCGLSTGSAFEVVAAWNAKFNDGDGWKSDRSYWKTIQFPDVNNDGQADVCGRGNTGIWCALSTGSAFAVPMQ
jgi:hypothetical protein